MTRLAFSKPGMDGCRDPAFHVSKFLEVVYNNGAKVKKSDSNSGWAGEIG